MMRKACFFLLIILSMVSCSFNRREGISLTSYDKNCLELFFRTLLTESAAGYSIYGNKPVCWESFTTNDLDLFVDAEIAKREGILREGYRVWVQTGLAEKTNKIAICATNQRSITGANDLFILNKRAFLKVVQENLALFQYVLGPKATPSLLLDQFVREKLPMLSILQTDRVLNGIVLGYGTQNALSVSRKEYIHEYIHHSTSKLIGSDCPSQPIRSQLPSFGFQTLQEEADALSKEYTVECHRDPTLVPPLPWFGSIPSQETDHLLADYKIAQKKIGKLLHSSRFLEEILSQLLETQVVFIEQTDRIPFVSLLHEKVKLAHNLSFFLGQASAKKGEQLGTIDLSEQWEAIEQLDLLSYL